MHRMTHFVDRVLFRLTKLSISVKGIRLQEKPDLVAGLGEILIFVLFFVRRRENTSHIGRIELTDQFPGPTFQLQASVDGNKVLENDEARFLIGADHIVIQLAIGWRLE